MRQPILERSARSKADVQNCVFAVELNVYHCFDSSFINSFCIHLLFFFASIAFDNLVLNLCSLLLVHIWNIVGTVVSCYLYLFGILYTQSNAVLILSSS